MRLDNGRRCLSRANRTPAPVRALTACAGLLTAAAALATPARANPIDESFLSALDGAGVNYADAGVAAALGKTVCPMLAKEGGTFASAADSVTGSGIPAPMADMFVTIAIRQYCPSALASIEKGQIPSLPKVPGVAGL